MRSLTSAGGVGALLQIADHATGKTYLPAYDGNGNVASLVNADTGATAAAYEYSPFGEPLRTQTIDATVADQPFRFSTKFADLETGLIYYGRRYYDPLLGRFVSRDPKEELGGINLYGFIGNNAINRWDYLGMCEGEEEDNDDTSDYLDDSNDDDWNARAQEEMMANMRRESDAEEARREALQAMARQAGTASTSDPTKSGTPAPASGAPNSGGTQSSGLFGQGIAGASEFWRQAIVDPNAPGSGIIAGIEGAGMGFLAGIDGALNAIPGVEFKPFESAGAYDSSQFGLGASQGVGGVTRDAALFFGGAAAWRALPVLGGGNLSLQASLGLSATGMTPLGVASSGTGTMSLMSSCLIVNGLTVSTATELLRQIDPDE